MSNGRLNYDRAAAKEKRDPVRNDKPGTWQPPTLWARRAALRRTSAAGVQLTFKPGEKKR